jgi:hypothetical protein
VVDTIGPSKVISVAKAKPVDKSTGKRAKPTPDTPSEDTDEEEKEKNRLGTNIDERC